MNGVPGDARENVFEPGERIDARSLAGSYEAPQHGRCPATFVASEEGPVVSADCYTADCPLRGVIIDRQVPVLAVAGQSGPVLQRVAHCPSRRTLRQHFRLDL